MCFLFFTLPAFETNYATLYSQIRFASIGSVDWWGYYGLFLTGNFIEILDQSTFKQLKVWLKIIIFYLHLNF